MRVLFLLVATIALHAQTVAIVNGKPVSQAELETFKSGLPPEMRQQMGTTDVLLHYYGYVSRMAELAEKEGLADKTPYKEQLAMYRKMLLFEAIGAEYGRDVPITPADEQKFYDEHKEMFQQADVHPVRVPDKAAGMTQIRRYDDNIASAIRDAVFAAKPGEVTRPVTMLEGVYTFRVDRIVQQPFAEIHGYVAKAISDERYRTWLAGVNKSVTVEKPPSH